MVAEDPPTLDIIKEALNTRESALYIKPEFDAISKLILHLSTLL
jgi:hypothetical protein